MILLDRVGGCSGGVGGGEVGNGGGGDEDSGFYFKQISQTGLMSGKFVKL